ncbi:hypothetical protein ACHAXS_006132 [Conticribra weissflogii]
MKFVRSLENHDEEEPILIFQPHLFLCCKKNINKMTTNLNHTVEHRMEEA